MYRRNTGHWMQNLKRMEHPSVLHFPRSMGRKRNCTMKKKQRKPMRHALVHLRFLPSKQVNVPVSSHFLSSHPHCSRKPAQNSALRQSGQCPLHSASMKVLMSVMDRKVLSPICVRIVQDFPMCSSVMQEVSSNRNMARNILAITMQRMMPMPRMPMKLSVRQTLPTHQKRSRTISVLNSTNSIR